MCKKSLFPLYLVSSQTWHIGCILSQSNPNFVSIHKILCFLYVFLYPMWSTANEYTLKWQVGHRTYNNMKTIRPNMALLGQVFLNKTLNWPEFQESVVEGHKNRQGQIRLRKAKQSLYTYPAPDCMCQAWKLLLRF